MSGGPSSASLRGAKARRDQYGRARSARDLLRPESGFGLIEALQQTALLLHEVADVAQTTVSWLANETPIFPNAKPDSPRCHKNSRPSGSARSLQNELSILPSRFVEAKSEQKPDG